MPLANVFDSHMAAWKEWQNAPWGRLRYKIGQMNLFRHLPEGTLRILDVGSGNGFDAIPLAALGHQLTLVDFSAEMLAEAKASAEELNVAEEMTFHQADLAALPTLFPEPEFDVILCHNLLQYVDDVTSALQTICQTLRPGGLLSIICVNRYSDVYRAALQQGDLAAAASQLEASTTNAGVFEVEVHHYAAEEMIQPLQKAGCMMLSRYGVRCVCDYLANNDLKTDPASFAQLEQLEYTLSDHYPYYLLARFFQIIAGKVD